MIQQQVPHNASDNINRHVKLFGSLGGLPDQQAAEAFARTAGFGTRGIVRRFSIFAEELNANVFYKRLIPASEGKFRSIAQTCVESKTSYSDELCICDKDGKPMGIIVDADYVDDELGDVRCILSIRRK